MKLSARTLASAGKLVYLRVTIENEKNTNMKNSITITAAGRTWKVTLEEIRVDWSEGAVRWTCKELGISDECEEGAWEYIEEAIEAAAK